MKNYALSARSESDDVEDAINNFAKESYERLREKGFYHGNLDISEIAAHIANCHSELTEAWEEIRAGKDPKHVEIKNGKLEGFPIELADLVIRVLTLSVHLDIDIIKAIKDKNTFNKKRPYKHGGKVV